MTLSWKDAVDTIPRRENSWTGHADIVENIQPFLEANCIAFPPREGSYVFDSVNYAEEKGCIEFRYAGRCYVVASPKLLTFVRIESDIEQSFLLLELNKLFPTGNASAAETVRTGLERLTDIGGANYVSRQAWDDRFHVYDDGSEIKLDDRWNLVTRFVGGKFLFVDKSSIWNQTFGDRDLHEKWSVDQIKEAIETVVEARAERHREKLNDD